MALDIYDSQYLLILVPLLVVALLFLSFMLFTKETSYDEVLARQKRDLKLPPSKPDARKRNEKKKSKKKESATVAGGGGGGGGGGVGGESEEDLGDFEVADGARSTTPEMVEDPEPLVVVAPDPPASSPHVPVPAPTEASVGLRERKKKEKKAAKAAVAVAAASTSPAMVAATSPPPEEPEVNSSKLVSHKTEPSSVANKQPSPTSPQLEVQVQVTQAATVGQTPPQASKKEKKKKQKLEAVNDQPPELKVEQAPTPAKKEPPLVAEIKVLDNAAPAASSATGSKKKNAKKQKTEPAEIDSAASANHQAAHNNDVPSKGSGKKQKNEADKEKTEEKLKELLSSLSTITLSEAEAVSLIAVLREKSPCAGNTWHKSAGKSDPAAQERGRLLTTLEEEASIAKDKVKQLSQELQVEKQKTARVESVMRDQCAAMEKELGNMQAKAQGSYQELQTMQMKFQQLREQLESQITRLQQENGILRDAVSSASNQMESKNSAEMNQLRSEYAALMKELADNNGKLQQEEHQRKSLEVSYKQKVSQLEAQLQDAKRRWEELQNFLHSVNTDREKLQASNQELHSQLMTMESELNNKNKELQTMHSSLAEAMVSKERLEQRVMELLEVSQHSIPDDSLQARAQDLMNENKSLQAQNGSLQAQNENLQAQISTQASHVSHIEELQKLLAEKELQRKSLEDSLNAERSSGASRETNMQALHNENMSMKADIQNLRAQISDQTASQLALDQIQRSVQEKEENMKTVESLLEKGLIEVANKEDELKTVREENEVLKQELVSLQGKIAHQVSSESVVQQLHSKIQERDLKLKSTEDILQAAQDSLSAKAKAVEGLEQQVATLQAEIEYLGQKEPSEELIRSGTQLLELQSQLAVKDQEITLMQNELRDQIERAQQQSVVSVAAVPSTDLLTALSEKEKQVSDLQSELSELNESLELHRKKNNELREKNWSAMEALSATESMLQGKLSKAVKENQATLALSEAECRNVLHRLLPHVPLPSEQNHQEWLCSFERNVSESSAAQSAPASGNCEELCEKLKEAEEAQRILQVDCETYKKVLAETEGILQRLQSSVEQEESRWKVKVELSQAELREMSQKVTTLEQEIERLSDGAEVENLRREKQHLESELERAERESATYVTEVRELKTQLTETLSKLEAEESERQQVAGDLYKAQQSLDLIQGELSKADSADDLIENSSLSSQKEAMDRKEKMTAGLNQTVQELQQLLQGVSRQLTKDSEADKDLSKV
ncbi:kinectin isoform X2 [Dunckerocampus dactyliophorus]|uniref:kinectin isoform X2 n=1 Tax=Dunckerocampus dactyliophorus TaxID=161453 RepID=UPI002406593F|nr:kinectin isoform X2 [Dunckerocampus dactyliophorus]